MKEYFKKLCVYYLNHFNKSFYKKTIKEAKKNNIDTKKIDKDAKEYINILKNKLKEFNYKGTKSETYEMINKYIKIKDDMDEEDKKTYLEILRSLCMIYNIDLRKELIDYITEIPKEEDIFVELCKYYLEDQDENEFNKIKERGKLINFEELDEKASNIIKDIKKTSKQYDINIVNTDSLYKEIDRYIINKEKYTDEEKSNILKVLAITSKLYNINLKQDIEGKYKKIDKENNFVNDLINPLDNKLFLASFLLQRYENCLFDIANLSVKKYYKNINSKEENYTNIQSKLMSKIINIYLDKINNYGLDDINPLYNNIFSINDLTRIDELTPEELHSFIGYITKRTEEEIVCRKLNISDNLYHFLIYLVGITDIFSDNIGRSDKNIFNVPLDNDNIAIYIGTNATSDSYELLTKYIVKCIENNINYNMKNRFNNRIKTILYANKKDFYTKISILDELEEENKEIISNLDKPIISASIVNGKYYAISTSNIDNIEYNELFDIVAEIAYYRVLAKLEINKKINEEDLKTLKDFIELDNINSETIKDINSFNDIKDLINKHIVEVTNTMDVYMKNNIETIIEEFQKSITYIFNKLRNNGKKSKNNISISKEDIT